MLLDSGRHCAQHQQTIVFDRLRITPGTEVNTLTGERRPRVDVELWWVCPSGHGVIESMEILVRGRDHVER